MKNKLLLGIPALVLLGCVVFIAWAKFTMQSVTVLRYAYASNALPVKQAIERFIADVESSSGGRIKILVFPDGQLGGERELVELMQVGAIDLTKVTAGLLEGFSPIYGVFSLPYLFDDEAHFFRVMDDPSVIQQVYDATRPLNFVGLTWYDSGQRSFYTRNKAIRTPADLKGLKIRVMQNQTSIRTVSALGGSPIAMNNAETYSAMQQGIIDGAESNEFALTVPRHGEVAKRYSYDMHTRVPDIVLINATTLDHLSAADRTLIHEASVRSTAFEKEAWRAAIKEARAQAAQEFGVVFNEDVDVKAFQRAVAPIYDTLGNQPAVAKVFGDIRARSKP
ncbi:MAG TPA: TRAP transporter substrate-binding protein [Rhodocyclaceae bacterium]|nr:TRAP transporter substrate-binding protein [Rhodocyclaceae bacterium]